MRIRQCTAMRRERGDINGPLKFNLAAIAAGRKGRKVEGFFYAAELRRGFSPDGLTTRRSVKKSPFPLLSSPSQPLSPETQFMKFYDVGVWQGERREGEHLRYTRLIIVLWWFANLDCFDVGKTPR